MLRAVPVRGRGKASGPGRAAGRGWGRGGGEGFAPAAVPGASGPYLSSLLRPPHAKPEGKAGTRDLRGEGGTERPPSPPEKRRQAPGVSQSGTAEARLGPGAPLLPTPASLPWGSRPSPRLAGSPSAPAGVCVRAAGRVAAPLAPRRRSGLPNVAAAAVATATRAPTPHAPGGGARVAPPRAGAAGM